MSLVPQIERQLHEAALRRSRRPPVRVIAWVGVMGTARMPRLRGAALAGAVVMATTTVTLAASGVILTGSPVHLSARPLSGVGEGIPVAGGERLLPLRVADPAGGLPWGMRIIHTTRGLVCVQVGRVSGGQLGQLGVDGAFHDDGRFHPLPPDALPEDLGGIQGWNTGTCASPEDTFAADSVGLELNAANSATSRPVARADVREISFGLLGRHAVAITYREGSATRTQAVIPGVGAYLLVQRFTSGRRLGSSSETDGRDERANYSQPAAPNGALTAITYSYAGRTCVDRGNLRDASCGLSEVPPPRPAPLPVMKVPLHARLDIHAGVIRGAEITFRAPYPAVGAGQSYSVSAQTCHGFTGAGTNSNISRGALVTIQVGSVLSLACGRSVTFAVEYVSFTGLPQPTQLGHVMVREPSGTHAAPLPRRVVEIDRRMFPTRTLHRPIRLKLLPQGRAACSAAFLVYPCYRGEIEFTAPFAATAPAGHYSVDGYATCKIGGRPETGSDRVDNVKAGETVRDSPFGLFVLTPSCASHEGFKVTYLNEAAPTKHSPHKSVILGTATLSNATQTR